MNTALLRSCLLALMFLALLLQSAEAADQNNDSGLRFETRISEISNLVHQLDCLANLIRGSREAYKELWQNKLNWSPADDKRLEDWRRLRESYHVDAKLGAETRQVLSYPPDHPGVLESQINLFNRLRVAAYQAQTVDEYQANLSLLVKPEDLPEFMHIVKHFYPRFQSWWTGGAQKELETFAAQLNQLIQQKAIAGFCAQVAKFYGAQQTENLVVPFNLMARPKDRSGISHGEQLEWHAVIEVASGTQPERRIDVVCHELFHYFKKLMPTEKQLDLLKAFVEAKESYSLALYNVFDETLATAAGNGLVAGRVLPERDFQKSLAQEGTFYADVFIDRLGKKMMPVVGRYISEGRVLDQSFVAEYLREARSALGEQVNNPLLALRVMALVLDDGNLRTLSQKLFTAIRPRSSYNHNPLDAGSRESFEKYAEISGVILVRYDKLKQLAGWEKILGKQTLPQLQKLKSQHQAFAYAVRRSPRAVTYIFAGQDAEAIEKVIAEFGRNETPFVGLKFAQPR
jgi:hypothetical protein